MYIFVSIENPYAENYHILTKDKKGVLCGIDVDEYQYINTARTENDLYDIIKQYGRRNFCANCMKDFFSD